MDAPEPRARRSLADEAYVHLREQVLKGEIPPGQRVTVRPAAQALGISPTPVSTALSRLARDGVLESKLHRGYFVPELGLGDVQEIYEVREGLDIIAVRRAARSEQHQQIAQRLAEYCDEQERLLNADDVDGYRAQDIAFHHEIWKLSGNRRLLQTGEKLMDQMRLGNAVSARRPGRGLQSVAEHRAIVEAIGSGDSAIAEETIRFHLQQTSQMFLAELACPAE